MCALSLLIRFASIIHRSHRLKKGGARALPSVRRICSVSFELGDDGVPIAVVQMPVEAKLISSGCTLDEYIKRDASAIGAGAGDNLLPCGHTPWRVQSVFAQLLHAVAMLHHAGLPGCLDRKTITVVTVASDDSDTGAAATGDGSNVAAASTRILVRVCGIPMPPSSSAAPEVEESK